MENKVAILKALGYDITTIIEGTTNEKVLKEFYARPENQDIIVEGWTEEHIAAFSETIYNLVMKMEGKQNGKEKTIHNGEI